MRDYQDIWWSILSSGRPPNDPRGDPPSFPGNGLSGTLASQEEVPHVPLVHLDLPLEVPQVHFGSPGGGSLGPPGDLGSQGSPR